MEGLKNSAESILRSEFYGEEWSELMGSLNTDVTPTVVRAMKKYALLVATETRKKCARRATVRHISTVAVVDKDSILDVEIELP